MTVAIFYSGLSKVLQVRLKRPHTNLTDKKNTENKKEVSLLRDENEAKQKRVAELTKGLSSMRRLLLKKMSVTALNDASSKLSPFDHKYGYKQEILIRLRLRDDKMTCEDHLKQQHMNVAGTYWPKSRGFLKLIPYLNALPFLPYTSN